jgi:hypothetical protein
MKDLLVRIMHLVCAYDSFFILKRDNVGKLGLSSHKKCIVVMMMFAYGITTNVTNEYCKLR